MAVLYRIVVSIDSIISLDKLMCEICRCVCLCVNVRKTSRLFSIPQCNDDVIVLSFPQHLPFKVQHLVFAAAQQDAHHLI